MRTRTLQVLAVTLLFALISCKSKPAGTAANSAAQDSSSANAGGNTTGSSAAGQQPAAEPSSSPSTSTSSTPASTSSTPVSTAPDSSAPISAAPAPPPAPVPPPPVMVPAGTVLTVRLGQAIGSKISSPGDSFTATLAQPVRVKGNNVIPVGVAARGKVIDAQPLGKLKGGALLEVRLTSITINGVAQPIDTASVSREIQGKGKRSAALAGGGAALGGIIGGIAGGGKGAAIGLLAGGGAGGAGAAYTGNQEIVLPAESALSFKLKAPLQVNIGQ